MESNIEVVKLFDGDGYQVRITNNDGENVVLKELAYSGLAMGFAESISEVTGMKIYCVEEIISTRIIREEEL